MSTPTTLYRLTLFALLLHLGRAFIDFQFVFPGDFGLGVWESAGTYVIYLLLYGLFIHNLPATQTGERRGLTVVLVLNLLFTLGISLGTITTYCPTPCATAAPLADILTWASLLVGLASSWGAFQRLRQS